MKTTLVSSDELKAELAKFEEYQIQLSIAGPAQYSIYILPSQQYAEYPNIMQEMGFQRKRAFSGKGAGGFDEVDIDEFDQHYDQLMVVRAEGDRVEIVGGYRFFIHASADTLSKFDMGRLFIMKNIMNKEFLPAVELGRSWAKVEYQGDKITFPLVLLGLGAIRTIVYNDSIPQVQKGKFWFGKVTNPADVQHLLLEFLEEKYPNPLDLFVPKDILHYQKNEEINIRMMQYAQAYKLVKAYMPEIWPIYLRMSLKLYTCGTAKNDAFGHGISETGLVIEMGSETVIMLKMFVHPVEELVKKKPLLMGRYKPTV